MAGGYGGLIGRFGLALDNLISAEVVLADGSAVHAGPDGDPELLWALRGGGGNFGVVTSATFRLHPLGLVLGGMVMYPLEQAGAVLRGYRDLIASAPDELTVMAGLLTGPGGAPVVFLAPTWSGDLTAGEAAVAPLTRLGTPLMTGHLADALSRTAADVRGRIGGREPVRAGHPVADRTDRRRDLRPDRGRDRPVLSDVAAGPAPVPRRRLAGRPGRHRLRPPPRSSARRGDRSLAPGDAADPHRQWIKATTDALAPGAIPGGYPNILGPDDSDRIRLGFAGNLDRLLAAKRRYDPDATFTAIAALTS